MQSSAPFVRKARPPSPWLSKAPVREELFGTDRLEQHARSLAAAETTTATPPRVFPLRKRLKQNADALLAAYRASATAVSEGRPTAPAAEWLLDNYHLVEEQIRSVRSQLPTGFYHQLPKLGGGPFAGYPRVFGASWAFVAHTDSHFDPEVLKRFLDAYQSVEILTIGELWAFSITLRIVLIENLRRIADELAVARCDNEDADRLGDRLLAVSDIDAIGATTAPMSDDFAAQLAKRLRDQDPTTTPALGWLERRLALQHLTIDGVVARAQQRQAAANVTVRNIITSLRLIASTSWADLFESVSRVDAALRAGSAFATMDFATRNAYRSAIEHLARGSVHAEVEIAVRALRAAATARAATVDPVEADRVGDPGYHLVSSGRADFERALRFEPRLAERTARFNIRLGIDGYVAATITLTVALLTLVLAGIASPAMAEGWLSIFAVFAFLPLSETANAIITRAMSSTLNPVVLPALELLEGPDAGARTLVVMPTLLTSREDICEQLERLEVHYLSGAPGECYFALLSDWVDADHERDAYDDALLSVAADEVIRLNARHEAGTAGPRFRLLHRRRLFNAREGVWMGQERKRGKLHELNRLLRGAADTTFLAFDAEAPDVPPGVRYVITLDADTRLPRETVLRLVGKMQHPLNRPTFDPKRQRVVDGYAILQPRVTPALPSGDASTPFQRAYSGPAGIDPYAAAISDVYQDLLNEGSYTGKGIYDVDAFEASLAGRVPDNTMLSHDLFEGSFARAGLATDVEVVEDFPVRYEVAARRQHRWTRGDWQLIPWIVGRANDPRALSMEGRWKMLDNLRRTLVAPSAVIAVAIGWLLPQPSAWMAQLAIVAALVTPSFLGILAELRPPRHDVQWRTHLRAVRGDLQLAMLQAFLNIAFLADRAYRNGDAVVRTLWRMGVTRRHLLEWTTAAQAARRRASGVAGFYREMIGGTSLVLVAVVAIAFATLDGRPILPLALLWLLAPAIATWASRSTPDATREPLDDDEQRELRLTARRTWRFFETFVTPEQQMLPPDNFQEDPKPVVAARTSPTNIGLYLLSTVAARDFGWIGTEAALTRLEATFDTVRRLETYNGHLFNWYATHDLRVLEPRYVSSVDSGNLAGHLIALANACDEWRHDFRSPRASAGIGDALTLAREARGDLRADHITRAFEQIATCLAATEADLPTVERHAADALSAAEDGWNEDLIFWVRALHGAVVEHRHDHAVDHAAFSARLATLARDARTLATGMDFRFLIDPERKLLSIGYSMTDNRLDKSCYDLLASEARLASLFAIAKGDAPARHWFRMGRTSTVVRHRSALVSWSGSMFEYLMPSLVMRAPEQSLIADSNRMVVVRQQDYATSRDVPWGISESAFNARDFEFTYQYSNFGVPGLGLKRGLADNLVIAPYATGLASMVDARAAMLNYRALAAIGGLGRHGFYEAIDFTRTRVPENATCSVVRNFMAHHQGMTIVSIANALHDGQMRDRFHREPMIAASELLLQERFPREVSSPPLQVEVSTERGDGGDATAAIRRVVGRPDGPPVTHLLSNGRYAVMVTGAGGGYSRWGDTAITRWREDPTRDVDGSYIYLRDCRTQRVWCATTQPLCDVPEYQEMVLAEHHAAFERRDGRLTTTLEILVSGEDDAEVRRVSLTNRSRHPREIELTSYFELVLTTVATDQAHPAFAKMFVQTEYLAAIGGLVATRRPRSADEKPVWTAHFTVVEGEALGDAQHESDRMRFIGRNRDLANPAAMDPGGPLSGRAGTVLDPIFALRRRVRIPPGTTARVAFWTMVASSRESLLEMVDRHSHPSAFDRAMTFSWTQAQIRLRHLGVTSEEAADFQRMAAPLLFADARFRVPSNLLLRGAGAQSGLWQFSISGDLPIVLLRIDDIADLAQVRQLLRAHEYWRAKRLAVDLVIVNERASSYVQDLQQAIEAAVRSTQLRQPLAGELARGAVFTLRADLMNPQARTLLAAVARVNLIARRGSMAAQFAHTAPTAEVEPPSSPMRRPIVAAVGRAADAARDLEFFNGLGGFAEDGREYVTVLEAGRATPAPWINVVANPRFGFHVSADGSGFTWAENSRENPITPWSNDPVRDPSFEAIYVRDHVLGSTWTATAQPVRDEGTYIARHGFGYSRFEHEAHGIGLDLLQYVPLDEPVKISRLTVRNRSNRVRHLSITGYVEWALAPARAAALHLSTERDPITKAIFARNPWTTAFAGRVAFFDLNGRQASWTGDRTGFMGRFGTPAEPAALDGSAPLAGTTGAGYDPCAALQCSVELAPGESTEIVAFLGQCTDVDEARALIERCRRADLDDVLTQVKQHWHDLLGTVQVRTPDRALDLLVNGWLLYQVTACRLWARSAFYQASGAYGFRDQLQDGMALTFARPAWTRSHLLRAASRQFVEGDVQHWWLPHSGQGVRTRISDDRVWLAYGVATYIEVSGDRAVLGEPVAFLEGPLLAAGAHDHFDTPMVSEQSATLFEHCARGLDQCIELTGAHGLPLMGTGDWNDGMNRVGQDGKGESVWLGWLFIRAITLFAPYAERFDAARVARWRAHATSIAEAIEAVAWDGAWYRRATFDDGTWLGSRDSDECRIDSIAQSWAVLSRAADPARARQAMASVEEHLVRRDTDIALLFTPPFDQTPHDPGYIKGYPPGLRENGGQYSHAAMWLVTAYAALGDGDKAAGLLSALNPINHARDHAGTRRYKVEPYVVAADVYSTAPHEGRGGWTWYTGSAAWMYRSAVEALLGIRREGRTLVVDPCLPATWPGFEATVTIGEARYSIVVRRTEGARSATLDGHAHAIEASGLRLAMADGAHAVVLTLGT